MDPRSRLLRLVDGYLATQLLYVAARLGVADVLAERPRTGREVAAAVGADPAALTRVLRGLAAQDVLGEDAEGRFALTPVGEHLRDGISGSSRAAALVRGELYYAAADHLLDAVSDGSVAFERLHGTSFFDRLAEGGPREAAFNASMAGRAEREAADVVAAYDFAGVRTLVHVGGGAGVLLAAVLRAAPWVRGVLLDRAPAAGAARVGLAAEGLDGRARCVEGDFFDAVPEGADAYLLSRVLHDWDDADAARILATCRRAAARGARLLVVEALLPQRAIDAPEAIRMDLHMLLLFGTAERTEAQYRALLGTAGFTVCRVLPTTSPSGVAVIEATASAS